jgi:hypothetical protein
MKKDNAIVSQSNKLIEASYKMTLAEKRVICLLVSKIHRQDEDFKKYKIKISDLAEFVGLTGSYIYTQTEQLTKKLISRVLIFQKTPNRKVQVGFLSSAEYWQKQGIVELCFDPEMKPFLLQLKGQFTNYYLKHIARLRSIYSIRIYELLKSYQRFGRKKFTIEHLRTIFQIPPDQYTQYNYFKRRVILPSQQELRDQTDIYFEFEEIKEGRKVTAILFLIHPNINKEPDESVSLPAGKQTPEGILRDRLRLAGYTANPDRIIKRDGIEIVEAGLDVALREMCSAVKEIRNPGGFIAKKLQDKAGLVFLLEKKKAREKADREEQAKQDAALVKALETTFEKEKNRKLEELVKNYTEEQKKAFKTWVDENYPSNEFVKPFRENGEPKHSYLKSYFLDVVIPEYSDFTEWTRDKKGITLQESPTGYRILEEQRQLF